MARKQRTKYEIECADRAKAIAKRKGLLQEDIAELLGMTQGAVGQYLNGPLSINLKFLLGFCRVVRCAPHEIDPEKQIFNMFSPDEEESIELIRSADPRELELIRRFLRGTVAKK